MKSKSISQLALEIISQGDNDDVQATLEGISKLLSAAYDSSMDPAHLDASVKTLQGAHALDARLGN